MSKVVHNMFHRIRAFCTCTKYDDDESEMSAIGTVDSVRLVYMRQIEEANSSAVDEFVQVEDDLQESRMSNEQDVRIVKHRMQKEYALDALKRALEEYELKNEKIMSKTKVPRSISSIKSNKTSYMNQNYSKDVFEEVHETMDDIIQHSVQQKEEELKRITEYTRPYVFQQSEEISADNSRKTVELNMTNNSVSGSVNSLTSDNISEISKDS